MIAMPRSLSHDQRMHESTDLLTRLRNMIGRQVRLHGDLHQVIEILPEGPVVVLQALEQDSVIQANAQGEASRLVPLIVEVPACLGGEKTLDPRVSGWLRSSATGDGN